MPREIQCRTPYRKHLTIPMVIGEYESRNRDRQHICQGGDSGTSARVGVSALSKDANELGNMGTEGTNK